MATSHTPDSPGADRPAGLHPQQVAAAAHRIDARLLATLVPGTNPADLSEIRATLARYAAGSRRTWASWQQAWNALIGPTRTVSYRPARCRRCHGRRFDVRDYARTGTPSCRECHGTGTGQPTSRPARPATEP